jgi:hypothetical protein
MGRLWVCLLLPAAVSDQQGSSNQSTVKSKSLQQTEA